MWKSYVVWIYDRLPETREARTIVGAWTLIALFPHNFRRCTLALAGIALASESGLSYAKQGYVSQAILFEGGPMENADLTGSGDGLSGTDFCGYFF